MQYVITQPSFRYAKVKGSAVTVYLLSISNGASVHPLVCVLHRLLFKYKGGTEKKKNVPDLFAPY